MSHFSPFHPAIRDWFGSAFGDPTPPQRDGWPAIREGRHTLIAAPTGSGKTLAAFLSAIDSLVRQGADLPDQTRVLYVSPLRALSNDVQKNLHRPLSEIRERDDSIPEVRVLVRTGDTPASERAAMTRRPPHILVTTPESLYLLLTSEGGRRMLSSVRVAIVDEIHSLARDKRGSHLVLSLERLEALAGREVQRVGLSATQKPLEEMARFLTGTGRDCATVDCGTFRELDLAVEIPPSPLSTVCSHEQWEEIYVRIGQLVTEHRTTLVFVNTRKMAERIAGQLTKLLGPEAVTSHHGSLSRERRLDAEARLKSGRLRALVATASLELGIDIGDVDLAIQVGATRSIATFLQRVGRSGHALRRTPKGRLFPLTLDELVEAAALLRCIRRGGLDRTPIPSGPLDILAQQIVAASVAEAWEEDVLFERVRRAWPYRDLPREDFDRVIALHAQGRRALLHRDRIGRTVRATRRARLTSLLSGGAIPDTADYQVRVDPEGTLVGTVNEDWAIESNGGDIFQLGNTSWRVLRVEPGTVRVADAKGQPPSLPFWLGEAPGRTRELASEVGEVREIAAGAAQAESAAETLRAECGDALPEGAAMQIADFVHAGRSALGAVPTSRRVVLERFFDESGGMQLVVHAPFGSRINRAWGLALRKKFCVGFGFELQAAANEEAIVLSLSQQHAFDLADAFDYLHPNTARETLVQAILPSPLFETRWRWNAQRALLLERSRNGRRVPANLLRMRANDLLASAFPQVVACPETLPGGPIEVPTEHPIVAQTMEDCLTEAMDADGFLEILRGLRDGSIERRAVDTSEPSSFARGILSSQPYTFLDDAPLEERRTRAVLSRRVLPPRDSDGIGALDAEAIARVREEAWPRAESAEEVHEALLWMGYVAVSEAGAWQSWLDELARQGRVVREGDRWFAAEAPRDPKLVLRGRLEALGPIFASPEELPILVALESEGTALRTRIDGREAWCDRRLLARIHRYTVDRLRREIEPVTPAQFLRFLACWQHADPGYRLEGPRGVADVVRQIAGFEIPAASWEATVLPLRVRGYRREWLDQVTFSGEIAWGRLWGSGASTVRRTPICLVPRDDLASWRNLAGIAPPSDGHALSEQARGVREALASRGAMFLQEIAQETRQPVTAVEPALEELIAMRAVTCDSFSGLRWLLVSGSRRGAALPAAGRWVLLPVPDPPAASAEFVARRLLARTGIVFRKTTVREKQPVPWRDVARVLRTLERRGEIRGGRFVAGFDGEQYAIPEAIALLRSIRRRDSSGSSEPLVVSAADPLNFRGILTPDERVAASSRIHVQVA